ncbi:Antigen 43 precursor [compost metagenome]
MTHTDGVNAGDISLRAYGLGGYWTHFGPEGWYLDGVLQFNHYKVEANPQDMELGGLKASGKGITASVEAGYPFEISNDKTLKVEPQAQLILSKIKLSDSHDAAADVSFEDVDSLTGRLGVRIDKDWFRENDKGEITRTNAWVRPSIWHEFKGQPKTEFSSKAGKVPFVTDMGGTSVELNLGLDYQVDKDTTITFSAGYQEGLDNESRGYEGIIGVKIDF